MSLEFLIAEKRAELGRADFDWSCLNQIGFNLISELNRFAEHGRRGAEKDGPSLDFHDLRGHPVPYIWPYGQIELIRKRRLEG